MESVVEKISALFQWRLSISAGMKINFQASTLQKRSTLCSCKKTLILAEHRVLQPPVEFGLLIVMGEPVASEKNTFVECERERRRSIPTERKHCLL